MSNLIITPVYRAFDKVIEMCDTIDKNASMDFLHVLAVDNCGDIPDIKSNQKRWIVTFRNDYIDGEHKSREGQALDLAYQFGTQIYTPYGPQPKIDYVFLIESDVLVPEGWDKKQIDLSSKLKDWATLDVNSVDKEGKLTYPTTVSPRHGYTEFDGTSFEHMHYADFQCTLFNPEIWKHGVRFSDFPDHTDILWSRKVEEITGWQHYRTTDIKAFHYTFSSRSQLPDELAKANEKNKTNQK